MRAAVLAVVCLVAATFAAGRTSAVAAGQTGTSGAKYVVYTRYRENDRLEVWKARVDGTDKRRLATGRSPQISPDGGWVVYRGGCDEYGDCRRLYLIPSAGGRRRLLVREGGGVLWSPDSRFVVVDGGGGLVRYDVEARRSALIARGDVQSRWGWSFSPTGDEIAYTVARTGRCFSGSVDIYVVGVNGGTPRRLTRDGCSAYPVWGTGGIAFARLIPYRGWGRHEIWQMNPDGGDRRTITGRLPNRLLGGGITGLVPIAWSDDGRRLLGGLANEFGFVPFAVDPERGTMHKIDDYGYADWPGGFSHDGQSVLVNVGDVGSYAGTRIEVVPYAGGRARVIARRAGEASWNL